MDFKPELFEAGCDRPLPVDRIVDEYVIGEVIPLQVQIRDLSVPVLLDAYGKKNLVDELVAFGMHRDWRGALHTYASAMGGVSADDLADNKVARSLEPVAETVEVDSPLEVLATSRVEIGDEKVKFELTPNASRSLLRGEPALVLAPDKNGGERRLEIVPTLHGDEDDSNGTSNGDGKPEIAIRDLGEFLAARTVDLDGRESAPIKLSASQVRNLVSRGRVSAHIGATAVELAVEESPNAGPNAASAARVVAQPFVARSALTSTPAPESDLPPSPGGPPPPPARPKLEALPVALYLPVKHSWELLGYSRGALVHSVGLSPQEELTLEVHSWQKFTTGKETTESTEFTGTSESTDTTRDSNEVLNEVARTNDLRNNLGGDLSYSGYGLNVKLNGGGSDVNTVTNTFRDTTAHLHELVTKTTNQLKTSRQVKVTEGSDIGSEERVTRRLRNPNMCHALTIDTFEVLAHYRITTAITRAGARLCVLMDNPLPFGFFTRDEVRHHEAILSQALLDAALRGGFAAARLLAERNVACGVACERCTCGDAREMLLGAGASEGTTRIFAALDKLRNNDPGKTLYWVDAIIGPSNANQNAVDFNPNNYAADRDRLHRWLYGALLKAANPDLYKLLLESGNINATRNDPVATTRAILAALAGTDPDTLRPEKLFARYQLAMEESFYRFYLTRFSDPQGGKAGLVKQTNSYWGMRPNDEGLADALKALVTAVQPKDSDASEQSDPVANSYPVGIVSQALEREEALLAHLNENRDYYRSIVFMSLPVQTQLDMLHSRGFDFPGIDLRPVGRDGSRLAFPLVTYDPSIRAYFEKIAASNAELDAACGVSDVVLPTPGIHLQTRLSDCDACEPYIRGIRRAEVKKRTAEAEQAQLEAQRYKKRLDGSDQDDQLLDDPSPSVVPPLHVILEKDGSGEPPV